jgi:hypothetical protein
MALAFGSWTGDPTAWIWRLARLLAGPLSGQKTFSLRKKMLFRIKSLYKEKIPLLFRLGLGF